MQKYEHSEVFATLKKTDERIQSNLSSYQYLTILDSFLYKALYPLIDNTNFVDHFLAKVLAWQYINPRRKAAFIKRSDLASYVSLFLISPTVDKKLKLLKLTKLDRGVLTELIRVWLNIVEPYTELTADPKTLATDYLDSVERDIEVKASLKPDHSLYGVIQQVKYWLDKYNEFKGMILEKYTRLCLNKAKQDYIDFQHRVPLNDIVQVYLVNAAKAIDKCDTEQGVLTSYIMNWLKNARNEVMTSQFTDVAYSLPKNSKTASTNMEAAVSVSFDDLAEVVQVDQEDEDKLDSIHRVRQIAKIFDPQGLGRLCLGIQEILSRDSQAKLRSLAA